MYSPPFGKIVYAPAISSGATSYAPSAMEGVGLISMFNPAARAVAKTRSYPTISATLTAETFNECASANHNGTVPKNSSLKFAGSYGFSSNQNVVGSSSPIVAGVIAGPFPVRAAPSAAVYTNGLNDDPG